MLCSYGCGRKAIYQLKNGKWCCENYHTKCPSNIKKNKGNKGKGRNFSLETRKKMSESALKRYKNNNFKIKMQKAQIGKKIRSVSIEPSFMFCSYGCGNFAKFYFPNVKKWCCSSHHLSCSKMHEKSHRKYYSIPIINTKKILCDYGCGSYAIYEFPELNKYCCSKNWAQCKEEKIQKLIE